jgi:hypothetical protein
MIHKPSANQAPPQEHLQLDCPELMPTRSHRSHPSWPVASGLDEGRRTAFRIQVVKRVKLKFNYECFETQNRVRPRSMPRRQPPTYGGRTSGQRTLGDASHSGPRVRQVLGSSIDLKGFIVTKGPSHRGLPILVGSHQQQSPDEPRMTSKANTLCLRLVTRTDIRTQPLLCGGCSTRLCRRTSQ